MRIIKQTDRVIIRPGSEVSTISTENGTLMINGIVFTFQAIDTIQWPKLRFEWVIKVKERLEKWWGKQEE